MRKVMRVRLFQSVGQTETQGARAVTCTWDIPYESLGQEEARGPLEEHMMSVLEQVMQPDQLGIAERMMYGALSGGGSVNQPGYTLTISFEKSTSSPSTRLNSAKGDEHGL